MCRSKAFSLAELLIIILLLAIVSGLVVPYAAGMTESQAKAAARIIAADLEYARMNAISSCQNVTATFNLLTKTYSLSYASGTLIHPITKEGYVVNLSSQHSLGDVRILSAFDSGAVRFDPTGAALPGGEIKLKSGSQEYIVEVDGTTGNIIVEEK